MACCMNSCMNAYGKLCSLPSNERHVGQVGISSAQDLRAPINFPAARCHLASGPRRVLSRRHMAVRSQAVDVPVQVAEPPAPNLFDGTTRLYYSPMCPYAQRVWIAVNYKGLDAIELVEINLSKKPSWYKEKVYPAGKVPALEHDGQVKGESLDLLAYLDEHFPGPLLRPQDGDKGAAAQELIQLCDQVVKAGYMALSEADLSKDEIEQRFGPVLQRLEEALGRYPEGPFFLGDFSIVDIVYVPFFERFIVGFTDVHKSAYDLTMGRPNLAKWLQALEGLDAYVSTRVPREKTREIYQRMLGDGYFKRIFSSNSQQAQSTQAPAAAASKAA